MERSIVRSRRCHSLLCPTSGRVASGHFPNELQVLNSNFSMTTQNKELNGKGFSRGTFKHGARCRVTTCDSEKWPFLITAKLRAIDLKKMALNSVKSCDHDHLTLGCVRCRVAAVRNKERIFVLFSSEFLPPTLPWKFGRDDPYGSRQLSFSRFKLDINSPAHLWTISFG